MDTSHLTTSHSLFHRQKVYEQCHELNIFPDVTCEEAWRMRLNVAWGFRLSKIRVCNAALAHTCWSIVQPGDSYSPTDYCSRHVCLSYSVSHSFSHSFLLAFRFVPRPAEALCLPQDGPRARLARSAVAVHESTLWKLVSWGKVLFFPPIFFSSVFFFFFPILWDFEIYSP